MKYQLSPKLKYFWTHFSYQKLDNLFKLTLCNIWTLAVTSSSNLSVTETALKTSNFEHCGGCVDI